VSLHLILAVFWMCVGVCLLIFRQSFEEQYELANRQTVSIFILMAFVVSAYNLLRWRTRRTYTRPSLPPPRRRHLDGPPTEYDPTFDFSRNDPPDPPPQK
jgi:hypothetical protein